MCVRLCACVRACVRGRGGALLSLIGMFTNLLNANIKSGWGRRSEEDGKASGRQLLSVSIFAKQNCPKHFYFISQFSQSRIQVGLVQ